jgi:hypothetical protein
MKKYELALKLSDTSIPAYLRAAGRIAVVRLNMGVYDPIELERETFLKMVNLAEIPVVRSSAYTFFRVEDDNGKLDVQTKNDKL